MARTGTRVTAADLAARFAETVGSVTMPHGWTPVGAWIRVSSGKQDEANQVPQVIDYCVGHHYWVAHWYVVHAKSASKGQHQADLDRAVEGMRLGEFSTLVIWHSDRIERRKGKALLDTLAEFTDAGGTVESVQEPELGQVSFGGQVTTFIAGLVNAEKIEHIKAQVGISHDRIRANHAVGPGGIPWGFTVEGPKYDKRLVPTDLCREIVPQIFTRCIMGESCQTIAKWLDSIGVPPKRGTKWNQGTVLKMLHNRAYAGRWQDEDKTTTLSYCEAVIPADVFDRAQEALKARPARGPVNEDNRPLLANLRCARCEDSPMFRIRTKSRSGKFYYYYRCTGRGAQRRGCGNMTPYDDTERIVHFWITISSDKPHTTQEWVPGKNYDAEISDVTQDIHEVAQNPLADGAAARFGELSAKLAELTELNKNRERGHYEPVEVRKPDGSVMTRGEYFHGLDYEAQREYLKTHDIRVERAGGGIRLVVDGEDYGVTRLDHSRQIR